MAEDPHDTQEEQLAGAETSSGVADLSTHVPLRAIRHDSSGLTAGDEDLIEWDVKIEIPPPRPSQTVLVRFVDGGRRPIMISEDPQD